jgi:two-component system OmpR family sensor kinase
MTPRPPAAVRRVAARTPLQVKLIVAVLALVAVALAVIGLASVAAVDGLLVGRLDRELHQEAKRSAGRPPPSFAGPGPGGGPRSPYLVQYRNTDGRLEKKLENQLLQEGQQPPRVPDDAAWLDANAGKAVTVPATGGDGRWRVAVQPLRDGSGSVVVAASLDGVDDTIRQLRAIDLVVSVVVLLALAGVGAVIVRASLRPLVEIEQTARAIAAGECPTATPAPRSAGSAGPSTPCWPRSRRPSGPGPPPRPAPAGPRRRPGAPRTGCGASSPTPATSCARP